MKDAYWSGGIGQIYHKKEYVSHSGLWSSVARKWYPWSAIGHSCHPADNGQMWQKQWCPLSEDFISLQTLTKCGPKCAPHWRTLSPSGFWLNVAQNVLLVGGLCHCSGLWPNVAQNVPLIWGLCLTLDFNQMWPKMCPSSENFVTQRTSTKCGPKCAPCWKTLWCGGLWPNVAQNVPLVRGLCHAVDFNQMWPEMRPSLEDVIMQQTSTKCGPKCAPCWRTLSHRGLWSMWPKICPSSEDFVMQWTLTKCGPKWAPRWRTLSHSELWPNVVQTCALQWVTLFCYGVQPHMDCQLTHHQKRPVPSKRQSTQN